MKDRGEPDNAGSRGMRGGPATRAALAAAASAVLTAIVAAQSPAQPPATALPGPAGARCRVDGHVRSGDVPLPGVAIVVQSGAVVKAATSTGLDGSFTIVFAPNATYHLTADLTAFTHAERDVMLAQPPCDTTVDFQLTLIPRGQAPVAGNAEAATPSGAANGAAQAAAQPAQTPAAAPAAPGRARRGARGGGAAAAAAGQPAAGGGRGAQPDAAGQRFRTLAVESEADGAATSDVQPAPEDSADIARLLPSGFSADTAQADAITVDGRADATSVDRGQLNDRQQAIRQGQLDPATGQFAAAQDGGPAGIAGNGGGGFRGRGAGPGGRGGGPGGGGPGGFVLGGRGARAQSPYQGTMTYGFGGSALDTPPYPLNPNVAATQPQFSHNSFGATFGGPLKIPGLYSDANRRTNFQFNYTGNRSSNLFDQYANVPTEAMRNGDFSATPVQLIDPRTGQPFPGNQIPSSVWAPGASVLLGFIPAPNLPGTAQNYHVSTTAPSSSDSISLRFTQNLSPTVAQNARGGFGGRGGGRGAAFGGRGGGRGGGPAAGPRPTSIVLSAQLQVRRNDTQGLNVFPGLGSRSTSTSVTVPVSLTVVKNRTVQTFTVNFAHTKANATNAFAGIENVADEAGIAYPATLDPLNWGVPNLSFGGFNLRGPGASLRTDNRVTSGYTWVHPAGKHQLRFGADYRFDTTSTEANGNARGTFTFTGLYSAPGSPTTGLTGADFADFLLGAPQQATLQVGGVTHLHGKSFDTYFEDNWQKNAKLTFNLGLRYELVMPYTEVNGQMANLDVAPGFTAAAPVVVGGTGPYTGAFPEGLINTDVNNIGPRVGLAYRIATGTILRGGYSITYNPGSYASIARQLVAQPPFARTETILGTSAAPLTLADALVSASSASTENNYGVDRNYSLGEIQTWNATLTRNLTPVWALITGYTGVKGTDLDLLSAPNRGPSGLLIPTVQPFIWESSAGHSILNAANFQLQRRLSRGVSGSVSYTLAKSMDNTPSLGSGGTIVAQNPLDPGAEWALSNFDRRQQLSGNVFVELPFGPNRRWLTNGGLVAGVVGGWSASMTMTAQSGTPLTIRILNNAANVAQGISGALRADYTGAPIALADPTINGFFNTAAFAPPAGGQFGNSGRNIVIGPGSHQLNASLSRDIRLGGNRAVTLQINGTNLLNTVQWATVETNFNAQDFGQITSIRPMRSVTVNARFRF